MRAEVALRGMKAAKRLCDKGSRLALKRLSDTVAAIHQSHLGRHAQELEPSSLDHGRLDLLFSSLVERVVILLGHVVDGQFVAKGSEGTVRIDIGEVEQAARRNGVFLLPLGCGSAKGASIGAAKPFNSIVAVGRISNALDAGNLGDFLASLAGQDLVLRFDPASLTGPNALDIAVRSSGKTVGTIYVPRLEASPAAEGEPPVPALSFWRRWRLYLTGLLLVFAWCVKAVLSQGLRPVVTYLERIGRRLFSDKQILLCVGIFGLPLLMLVGARLSERFGSWALGVSIGLSVLLLVSLFLYKTLLAWRWLAATLGAAFILGATLAVCLSLDSLFPP
jgi:hypothetical protein